MFERATFLSCFFLLVCASLWLLRFTRVTSSDVEAFKAHLAKSEKIEEAPVATTTQQQRQGVQKEIWFTQTDGSRLHYRIRSGTSELSLIPRQNKFEIQEKLLHMQCWMQDKLYPATPLATAAQQVRFFEAEEGFYYYNMQQFLAQTTTLSLYRLPGHDLPVVLPEEKAFMKGISRDVSFSVSGKNPQFQAKQFKATLRQED